MGILTEQILKIVVFANFLTLPLHTQILIGCFVLIGVMFAIRFAVKTIIYCLTLYRMTQKERQEYFSKNRFIFGRKE